MPSCCFNINRFLRKTDLFAQTNLVRYNGQAEYSTAAGGFISMAVIVIFLALFFNMGLKTINKEIISTSDITTESHIDPLSHTFRLGAGHDMMLGVFISTLNLSQPNRYFDISLYEQHYTAGFNLINNKSIPLIQCTPEHANFNSELGKLYLKFPLSYGLCPAIGQTLTVEGQVTSSSFKRLVFTVNRCDNAIDPTCANDTLFNARLAIIPQFQLAMAVIKQEINAGNQHYKEFIIEQKHLFLFDATLGVFGENYINVNTVHTDESIMPWEDIKTEQITGMEGDFRMAPFMIDGKPKMAQIVFNKAAKSTTITRTFFKIDNYLSYVGGLVGTIIGIFFVMSFYTEKAYEVSIAKKLLVDNDDKEISSKNFHVGYYLLTGVKRGFNYLGVKLNWPQTQKYIDVSQEICEQIDIGFLVRRINILDAAISALMEKHELQALNLKGKPNLEKAKKKRKAYYGAEMVKKYRKDKGEKGSNESEAPSPTMKVHSEEHLDKSTQAMKRQEEESVDFSDMDQDSVNEEDMKNIQQTVRKIKGESQRGKGVSQKVIEQIPPTTIEYLEGGINHIRNKKVEYVELEKLERKDTTLTMNGMKSSEVRRAKEEKKKNRFETNDASQLVFYE